MSATASLHQLADELLAFDATFPGDAGAFVEVNATTWRRWVQLARAESPDFDVAPIREALAPLKCDGCGTEGTRLDLDTKQDPPQHVCPRCAKKGVCPRCRRRVGRRVALPQPQKVARRDTGEIIEATTLCLRCAK